MMVQIDSNYIINFVKDSNNNRTFLIQNNLKKDHKHYEIYKKLIYEYKLDNVKQKYINGINYKDRNSKLRSKLKEEEIKLIVIMTIVERFFDLNELEDELISKLGIDIDKKLKYSLIERNV